MLEPAEALGLGEPVQVAVLQVALVGHAQLPDRGALLPLVHKPEAGGEQLARLVHVTQVGRAKAHKAVHLVFQGGKEWKSCSCDDTAHRVADEGEPGELIARAVLAHVLEHLIAKTLSHLGDITISLALVGR